MLDYTVDTLFREQVTICQPTDGYRFSMDPVLLATHTCPRPFSKVLDIGCGCGIMLLILGHCHPDITLTGVEIQPRLARLARTSIHASQLSHRIRILNQDINQTFPFHIHGRADLVVTNPPYIESGRGRINPCREKALARHEITLDLDQVVTCAHRLLRPSGQMMIIFPVAREKALRQTLTAQGFGVVWVRFVHTTANTPPKRILVCAAKNRPGPGRVRPPLFLTDPCTAFKIGAV